MIQLLPKVKTSAKSNMSDLWQKYRRDEGQEENVNRESKETRKKQKRRASSDSAGATARHAARAAIVRRAASGLRMGNSI